MNDISIAISVCETAHPLSDTGMLGDVIVRTCWEAGFPACDRIYVGSNFCENYFLALDDRFHDAVRATCEERDICATLVVPIFGQAFIGQGMERTFNLLDRYADTYDEVVVNDVAAFHDIASSTDTRMGIGRLFTKTRRDVRYAEVFTEPATPELSPEALACLEFRNRTQSARPDCSKHAGSPLVEIDPVSSIVDASRILHAVPDAEIAVHLPFAYATTGRNCSSACIDMADSEKFRLGRGCNVECLRIDQGSRVEAGTRYVKLGRTYFYPNPGCQIAGTDCWRIVYAAEA